MEKVYVIGHKNPDTDSTVAAISMAEFLNLRERTDKYVAAIAGELNSETEYILDRFGIHNPEILKDAKNEKLFLVDHNEPSQFVNGAKVGNIIGFVDHHKIRFECSKPIEVITMPWGSTNTLIYYLFKKDLLDIPDHIKPLILAAIISDTVILKSPTTTHVDRTAVEDLSEELGIDYRELGMAMFNAKAKISDKSPIQIIKNDFKDFEMANRKIGVGQIESPGLTDIEKKLPEILKEMQNIKAKENYHSIILMLTDILEEGSKLLVVSDETEKIANIFNTEIDNNLSLFIDGMMSRKKQVAPVLNEKL